MTVSSTSNRTSVVGNATAGQQIPFTFPVLSSSELVVIKRLITTGVETILTLTTDYTVSLNDDDTGGTVTLVSAIAATYQVHVVRNTLLTQLLDLMHGGTFNAENIEDALDKLTKICVDYDARLDRSLHEPETDTTTGMEIPNRIDRASAYLYFDGSGNATAVNPLTTGTASISPFAVTILDDASASATLTTLGFTAMAKTLLAINTDAAFLTELGVTAFAQSLLLDSTAAEARETLDVLGVSDIVCNDNEVVCYDDEVVTYS